VTAGPIVIVESEADVASRGIVARLRSIPPWEDAGRALDGPSLRHGDLRIVRVSALHIHCERLDERLRGEGIAPRAIVFASRHASASGRRSLTVHPIGNFGEAAYGGNTNTLSPAAAHLQSHALRQLAAHAKGLPYEVTFEATHHGPALSTPAFFVETGSDEAAWTDAAAHDAIARTLLELPRAREHPRVVAIGGGHYAPRHVDAVRTRSVDVGHIVSDHAWALGPSDDLVRSAFDGTGTREFLVDPRSKHAHDATARLEAMGYRQVRPEELAALAPTQQD
jgi:D-aminoacyl-tRNA deacylase